MDGKSLKGVYSTSEGKHQGTRRSSKLTMRIRQSSSCILIYGSSHADSPVDYKQSQDREGGSQSKEINSLLPVITMNKYADSIFI